MQCSNLNIMSQFLLILKKFLLPIIVVLFFCPMQTKSQDTTLTIQKLNNDSLQVRKKGDLDTLVKTKSKDSIIFDKKNNLLKLYGNAELIFRKQKLSSHFIQLDLKNALLEARPKQDSNNKISNFPIFNDNGEEIFGKVIKYNFRTKQGIIDLGETKMSEGFYFGSKIKKISEKELFVQDGCYTTCDHPHPHYYFGSPKMKVVAGDKVFVDPLILYVADMPVFMVPFGFYIPNKTGRQSGLIVPSYFFSTDRGVVLENLGFYWAASDYWDMQFGANLYSKGGFIIKNNTRVVIGNYLNGNLNLQYGKTRFRPDDQYTTNWSVSGSYYHQIDPMQNINGNFNFASQDFNRNTQINLRDLIVQNISSDIGYSKTFENNTSFGISYQRNQNIITNEYSQSIPIRYSIPNFYPLKQIKSIPKDSWIRDISFSLSTYGSYSNDYTRSIEQRYVENKIVQDTIFKLNEKKYISYSPNISISPKFGYFTLTPSISFGANTFFRRLNRTMDTSGRLIDKYENGLFWEYFYRIGISTSTRLYGMWDDKNKLFGFISPNGLGLIGFRHTYNPTFSLSYSPDFSAEKFGFYSTYYNPQTQQNVQYSRFVNEGGSHAPSSRSFALSYSDLHSFEIKIKTNDSIGEKKIELLRINLSTGYNFAADSLKLSPLYVQLRSPVLDFMNFSGNAGFTFYDEAIVVDSIGRKLFTRFVDRYLITQGKGLARLTNFSFSISSSFSRDGFSGFGSFGTDTKKRQQDSLAPGDRFSQRINYEGEDFDFFAENIHGYSPLDFPWSINFSLNYSYNQFTIDNISRTMTINSSLNFSLTPTWSFTAATSYDFISGEILAPYITVRKDLHCWELNFSWSPSKINGGFYLSFGIKASQLRDLKIDKRSSTLYR